MNRTWDSTWKKAGFRERRIPYIAQVEYSDCGPACLAMTLGFFGHHIPLSELRTYFHDESNSGVTLLSLVETAQQLGLSARAVRAEVMDVKTLTPGAILHWKGNHFVVLESQHRGGISIVDPALGRRFVSTSDLARHFTGAAVVLEPSIQLTQRPRGNARRRWVWQYITREWRTLARLAAVSLLLRALAVSFPLGTAILIDGAVLGGLDDLVGYLGVGLGVLLASNYLGELVRAHFALSLRARLDFGMSADMITHIASLPFRFFGQRSVGDLMMRVGSNRTIREAITAGALSAVLDGALVLCYLGLVLYLSPTLGLLLLFGALLGPCVFLLTKGAISERAQQEIEARARSEAFLAQALMGIRTLKAAGAESTAVAVWTTLFANELNCGLKSGHLRAVVDGLTSLVSAAAPFALLIVGAQEAIDGRISLGTALAVFALGGAVMGPVGAVVEIAFSLAKLRGYFDRIEDVFSHKPEGPSGRDALGVRTEISGALELTGASYRYAEDRPWAVRDVNLAVRAGESVAVVGPTGCGKSTLLATLVGFCPLNHGTVTFGGLDLTKMNLRELRRQVYLVLQHPYIFSASIAENIAMGRPTATRDEIIDAARIAMLHDAVAAMPLGYDTPAGEGGVSLSGGERQRLAIARGVLLRPSILVLDEATAALDEEMESAVFRSLVQHIHTLIFVTHRHTTLQFADRILVMNRGELTEQEIEVAT